MDKQKDNYHNSELSSPVTFSDTLSSETLSETPHTVLPLSSTNEQEKTFLDVSRKKSEVAGKDASIKNEASRFQFMYNERIFHSLFKRYFWWSGLYFVILTIGFLIGSFVFQGIKGVLASVVGAILVLVFCSVTPLTAIIMMRLHYPQRSVISAVLITWVLKLLIVFGVLVFLSKREWFNHYTLVIIIFCGVIGILLIESAVMVLSPFGKITPSRTLSTTNSHGVSMKSPNINKNDENNARFNFSDSNRVRSSDIPHKETIPSDISFTERK